MNIERSALLYGGYVYDGNYGNSPRNTGIYRFWRTAHPSNTMEPHYGSRLTYYCDFYYDLNFGNVPVLHGGSICHPARSAYGAQSSADFAPRLGCFMVTTTYYSRTLNTYDGCVSGSRLYTYYCDAAFHFDIGPWRIFEYVFGGCSTQMPAGSSAIVSWNPSANADRLAIGSFSVSLANRNTSLGTCGSRLYTYYCDGYSDRAPEYEYYSVYRVGGSAWSSIGNFANTQWSVPFSGLFGVDKSWHVGYLAGFGQMGACHSGSRLYTYYCDSLALHDGVVVLIYGGGILWSWYGNMSPGTKCGLCAMYDALSWNPGNENGSRLLYHYQ